MSDSIYSVVGKMQTYSNYFRVNKKYDHLLPFLTTYKLVTEQVVLKNQVESEYFADFGKMSELDCHFADLYFGPLAEYLAKEETVTPWLNYYDYCENGHDSPFLQILMGINVHINADLPHALVLSGFELEEDYEKINQILLEVMPQLMRYLLIQEYEVLGLAGMILRKFFVDEFVHIIVRWRKQAWQHALQMKSGKLQQVQLNSATENLSQQLALWWEQDYKLSRPWKLRQLIAKLNSAEIKV